MSERRYCRKCREECLHDIKSETSLGEKLFIGVSTLGMVPLFESLDTKESGYWRRHYVCQKCGKKTVK